MTIKKIFKALSFVLLLLLVFTFVGCDETDPDDPNKGNNNEKEEEKNPNGGNTEQGNKDGIIGTLGDNYTIKITYSAVQYGDTIIENAVFKGQNGVRLYQLFSDDAEYRYLIKNGHLYDYNKYVGFYSGCSVTDVDDAVERRHRGWTQIIKISENAQKIEFTGEEKTTFLGRECTKYINKKFVESDGWMASYDVDAYYIVDKDTKVCLKYDNVSKVYDTSGNVTDEGHEFYEITEFSVGSTNLNDELSLVKFDEWPNAEYFRTKSLQEVTKPVGTFDGYNLECDEEQNIFTYYRSDYLMTENDIRTLCNNFYNAGVKYDYDEYSTVKAFEEIFNSEYEGYISFQAYSSNGTYININAELDSDGLYLVSISF